MNLRQRIKKLEASYLGGSQNMTVVIQESGESDIDLNKRIGSARQYEDIIVVKFVEPGQCDEK